MAEGYIITQVYTSRSMIPIRDASVSITKEENNKITLVGFRKTDINGKTSPVTLQTPDMELSLEPGFKDPFATCNILIQHPQFYSMYIKNAQVFANNTTLQKAELIPLEEGATTKNAVETFEVLPQNL